MSVGNHKIHTHGTVSLSDMIQILSSMRLLGRRSPLSCELLTIESLGVDIGRQTWFVLHFQHFTQKRYVALGKKEVRGEQVIVRKSC